MISKTEILDLIRRYNLLIPMIVFAFFAALNRPNEVRQNKLNLSIRKLFLLAYATEKFIRTAQDSTKIGQGSYLLTA